MGLYVYTNTHTHIVRITENYTALQLASLECSYITVHFATYGYTVLDDTERSQIMFCVVKWHHVKLYDILHNEQTTFMLYLIKRVICCILLQYTSTYENVHMYVHAHNMYTYLHTYIHTYTHIHTYIHTHLHACVHTYIHKYINTNIHIVSIKRVYIHTLYVV